MTMARRENSIDAAQLGRITRTCTRWIGIASLPAPIRCRLEELDSLSHQLLARDERQDEDATCMLAQVRESCRFLRAEFARIQISFVCPSCPLRSD